MGVDLDTGRTRSWVETKEYEVLDLTGDTPAKPSRSLGDASNKPNIITNLARELGTADNDNKDAAGKMREISPLPGKQQPAIRRGTKRIPLADIMVKDGPGDKVDDNQCPVFSATGRPETLPASQGRIISDSLRRLGQGCVLASLPAPHLVRNIPEESVILIDDTAPASTRAGARRSSRANV